MIDISKHPFDWIIHATLNFIFVFLGLLFIKAGYGWFIIGTAIFVSVMIEYEQWKYAGKPKDNYFIKHVLGDLMADAIGILGGIIV